MLIKSATKNPNLSKWAKWAVQDEDPAARETREFLETCFANVASNKQGNIRRAMERENAENVDARLHELVCHELFRRLHLEPEFQPRLGCRLTPDMLVKVSDQGFFVDVYVVANPSRTTVPHDHIPTAHPTLQVHQLTIDHGDRAKKIRDVVRDKHGKYTSAGKPMLIVVFFKDHWMQVGDVESGLYGAQRGDKWLQDCFPHAVTKFIREAGQNSAQNLPVDGAMLPDDDDRPRCPKLSAVLACDWFDTLNRDYPGKRLHCTVLHHWKPDVALPIGRFGEFPEIVWREDASGCFRCELIRSAHSTAKFTGPNALEFRDYDPANPW